MKPGISENFGEASIHAAFWDSDHRAYGQYLCLIVFNFTKWGNYFCLGLNMKQPVTWLYKRTGGISSNIILFWAMHEGDISGAGSYLCPSSRYKAVSMPWIPDTQTRRLHMGVYSQPKNALLFGKTPETMDLPAPLNQWFSACRLWPLWQTSISPNIYITINN